MPVATTKKLLLIAEASGGMFGDAGSSICFWARSRPLPSKGGSNAPILVVLQCSTMKPICVFTGICLAAVAMVFHRSVMTGFDWFWFVAALTLGACGAFLGMLAAKRIRLQRPWKLGLVLVC